MFLEEKVDVAILEVGVGGRLDATNCIPKPVVCGVTSLGFDHVELLGHTLPVNFGTTHMPAHHIPVLKLYSVCDDCTGSCTFSQPRFARAGLGLVCNYAQKRACSHALIQLHRCSSLCSTSLA